MGPGRTLLVAVAALGGPGMFAGSVAAGTIALPATTYPVTSVPPLQTPTAQLAMVVPGQIDTFQRVVVLVDSTGRPVGARLRDRLVLHATGDYSFAVGGPFSDVRPGPQTESEPGFQTDAILWRGFAVRRRVLEAVATMRLPETTPFLPLRVSISTRVGGRPLKGTVRRSGHVAVTLSLTNATQAEINPFAGTGDPAQTAAALDRIREAAARGRELPAGSLEVQGDPRPRTIRAIAPLRVRGELRFEGGTLSAATARGGTVVRTGGVTRVHFQGTLGDAGPPALRVHFEGDGSSVGAPRLELIAQPTRPKRLLRPSGGSSWSELARRRTLDGDKLVDVALASLFSTARAGQYQEFVKTPGNVASRATDYVFRTAPIAVAQRRPATASGGGKSAWATVGFVAGALLLLGAAVVAWAHL